ncbi:NmrA/HSCARG family protein [Rhizobium sp. NFR03]|uniref:NmrA/HSCARG family protein n=1 Tax=Rhizobium sp. NFR03 TaxID=1566263 RepID=UPI000B823565|nr:NmrA/HSCARG family protein [Rhizobium sp. NFR03]
MKNDKPPILVFGATGRQGGSVARALLREGWPVRALVRNPSEPASVALRNAGLEVMTGSFQDPDAMLAAMKDTYGIFSVLPADMAADDEIHYGTCIADLASESGIAHFVYSSGASVGDVLTGVPRFDAKPRVEAHIRQLPITATIIRPMIFMEMLVRPGLGLHEGRLVSLIKPENSIQLIAVEDIGKFVAAIFTDPIKFSGVTLKIASDRVTGHDLGAAFTAVAGRPISYARFSDDVLAANIDLAHMAWSLENGPLAEQVDLNVMRELNPEILSFQSWLGTSGRQALDKALDARLPPDH